MSRRCSSPSPRRRSRPVCSATCICGRPPSSTTSASAPSATSRARIAIALERFAGELLPVHDSLALGVANGANADAATLLAGQQATLKLLDRAFEKFSIAPIDPAGTALRSRPARGGTDAGFRRGAPDTVLTVVQPATSSTAGCCDRLASWSPGRRRGQARPEAARSGLRTAWNRLENKPEGPNFQVSIAA